MCTKLDRIVEFARNNPKDKFTSLMHLVNKEMLTMCHYELSGNKTTGVDNIIIKMDKEKYNLAMSLNPKNYTPKPLKRIHIKKKNRKLRPIGIPTILSKFLKAGFIYKGFKSATEKGTPQGGIIKSMLIELYIRWNRRANKI